MHPIIPGIHHVTAITANAQKNIDFYCGVLGLRLVKLTVNFDDPSSYHIYYGDELGRPGTIMTFFVWPGAVRGRVGPPQVTSIAFAIPPEALNYWFTRLADYKAEAVERFGSAAIHFLDPDGIRLEIISVSHQKQTCSSSASMSALCQQRTFYDDPFRPYLRRRSLRRAEARSSVY